MKRINISSIVCRRYLGLKKVLPIVVLLIAAFMLTFLLSGVNSSREGFKQDIVKGSVKRRDDTDKPVRNKYSINARFDGENNFQADMDFVYVNETDESHDELFFHLYPNVFRSSERLPFLKKDLDKVFPDGFSTGGLDITEATQEGNKVDASLSDDGQILKLSLKEPVKPGGFTSICIKFNLTVPRANYRLGYRFFGDKLTLSLGHWYPILAVYEDGNWCLDRLYAFGDPIYSDVADYAVSFDVPHGFTVAASGALKDHKCQGNRDIYVYSMDKIREFGACVSNNYEKVEGAVDGIKVISYFHPEDKEGGFMALDIVKQALFIFNRCFGDYPYPEIRIAEANFYAGGMEFPTFVMMNTGKYKEPYLSNTSFERSVAHEVAHQWWYGLVGSDQINEPWMDEGLTEFSTLYYFEKRYKEAGRESYYLKQVKSCQEIINRSKRKMLDPLYSFDNNREYFAVVYVNGAMFYEDLRARIGEERLIEFLRCYLETYKYENVSFSEFRSLLEDQGFEELDEDFYKKWF